MQILFMVILLNVMLTSASLANEIDLWTAGNQRMQIYGIRPAERLEILSILDHLAKRYSINTNQQLAILALIEIESHYRQDAVSSIGAIGLMQLTPPAVKDASLACGIAEPNIATVNGNLLAGVCYIKWIWQHVNDWTEILIAYNGGLRHVYRYRKGQQIPKETANYVIQNFRIIKEIKNKKSIAKNKEK